jgi:hypothetical protein
MSEDNTIAQDRERNFKYYANIAINQNVKDTTARDIIRYVMECELWGQDIVNPSNEYLTKKFGWTAGTTRVAVSLAKKSEFITTTGSAKTRTFELNVSFLKGKIAELVVRSARPSLELPNDLPNVLPDISPNNSPNILPNKLPNTQYEENADAVSVIPENEGDNNSNVNSNMSSSYIYKEDTIKWQPIVNYFYENISPSVPHNQRFRSGVKEGAIHLLSLHSEATLRKSIDILKTLPDKKFTPNFLRYIERVDALIAVIPTKRTVDLPTERVATEKDKSFLSKILYGTD